MNPFRRAETPAEDQERTVRMLDALDAAGADPDDFDDVILAAAGAEVTSPYPPPGHGYPRR